MIDHTEEEMWVRGKLNLPPNATMYDVFGELHVWDSRQHGYMAYIKAYKCNDKQGEIARLREALKRIEIIAREANAGIGCCDWCKETERIAKEANV